MARKFNIDILLNLITEGGDSFKDLEKSARELARNTKRSERDTVESFRKIAKGADDVSAKYQKLIPLLKNYSDVVSSAKAAAPNNIIESAGVENTITQINYLLKQVRSLRKELDKRGQTDLVTGLDEQIKVLESARRAAKKYKTEINDINSTDISPKISSEIISEFNKAESRLDKFSKVFIDLENKLNSTSAKKEIIDASQLTQAGKEADKLIVELDSLLIRFRSLGNLGDKSLEKQLLDARESAASTKQEFSELYQKIETKNKTEILPAITSSFKEGVKEVSKGVGELQKRIEDAEKAGTRFADNPALRNIASDLISNLVRLKKEGSSIGIDTSKIDDLAKALDILRPKLELSKKDLNSLDEITRAAKLDNKVLADSFVQLSKSVADTNSQIQKSKNTGTLLENAPIYRKRIEDLKDSLENLRKQFIQQKLDVTGIDLAISKLGTYNSLLAKTDNELENLDKQVRNNKLTNLVDVEKDRLELKEIEKEIAQLIKLIDEAKTKGKTISIVTEFKEKVEQAGNKLNAFAQRNTDPNLLKNVARGKAIINNAKSEIGSIQSALPQSTLGKVFVDIGERIRGIKDAFTEGNGAFKTISTGLRLIGTTAFVAGGNLRVFGFAFSALGSIMQNFAPVAFNVLKALGPLAPLFTILLAGTIAVTTQAALLATALGATIVEGIKFNSQFKVAQNNISGLINEFFNIRTASDSAFSGIGNSATDLASQFQLGQQIAGKFLDKLEKDALVTNFTFQELLEPFQSVITALGTANRDLGAAENLAVNFARVATLVGFNAGQLNTSIQEILSGRGRATNRIQNLLNNLQDSDGIALTARRIRELKATNPEKFVEEINTAFARLSYEAAEANSKTIPGLISNFKDLFGRFSRQATLPGVEILEKGLKGIYNSLLQVTRSDFDGKIISVEFTERVQKILNFFTELSTLVLEDLTSLLKTIVDYVLSLADYFDRNRQEISEIYDFIILILKNTGLIVYDFLKILGIVGETNDDFTLTKITLGAIYDIIQGIRLFLIGISSALDTVKLVLNIIFLNLFKNFRDVLAVLPLPSELKNYGLKELDGLIQSREKSVRRHIDNLESSGEEISGIVKEFLDNDGRFVSGGVDFISDFALDSKDSPDKIKKVGKSVLKSYLEYYDSIIGLAKNRTQIYLNEVEKRIESELKLYTELEKQGIKSASDLNDSTAALEKQRINTQLKGLQEDEKILKSKLDSEANGKKKLGIINLGYELEAARIREEFRQKGDEGDDRTEQLNSRLAELNNKRNKDLLAVQQELEDIESRRKILKASILQIDVDLAAKELERVSSIRKDLAALRAEVAQTTFSPRAIDTAEIRKSIEDIIEPFRKNRIEIEYLQEKISLLQETLKKEGGNPVLEAQLRLYQEQATSLRAINQYTVEKIALEQRARELTRIDQNVQLLQNGLRREEDAINLKVTRGLISQRDSVIELTVARKQYKNALEQELKELQKLSEQRPLDYQEKDRLRDLQLQIESLNTTVTESVLLNINQEVGNGLIDFLEKVQENVGNTSDALKDLGNTFLRAFRKTVAQQIVEQFFTPLLGQLNQTEGKAQGLLAGFLRNLGIEPAVKQQAKVDSTESSITAKVGGLDLRISQKAKEFEDTVEIVKQSINERLKLDDIYLNNFRSKVDTAAKGLDILGNISIGLYSAIKDSLNFILNNGGKLNDSSLQQSLKSLQKSTTDRFASLFGQKEGSPLTKEVGGQVVVNPEGTRTFVTGAIKNNAQAIISNFLNILDPFRYTLELQREVGIENVKVTELNTAQTEGLTNSINNLILQIGDLVETTVGVAATTTSSGKATGSKLTGLFDTIVGVIDAFKGNAKATGGYISGKGGRIQDMVPAMLSNGEYVINAAMVQKYGKSFFDRINKGFAAGGFVIPDASKFDYSGGGAKLLNKPTPISVDFAALQAAANPKKPGLFKRIFGGALSFAAPFLNLIPGIGPFLSIAAGAAGGALSGTDKKTSILGGILGGLGNFGGFADKGGKLGGIADFLKKSKVKDVLGVFGGALSNGSSTLGFLGNSVFEKYFAKYLNTKRAMGGYIRKPKKYLFGGLVSAITGLFKSKSVGTGLLGGELKNPSFFSKLFGGKSDGGGLGALLGLFSGFLGGGSGNQKSNDFDTVNPSGFEGSADPDYARKNLYGSAYNFLTESGAIASFNYTKEILDFIDSVYAGTGNTAKQAGSGILGTLLGFGTTAASLLTLFKKKNSGSLNNLAKNILPAIGGSSAGGTGFFGKLSGSLKNIFGGLFKADGGFIQGAGSGISDSIPAMLSNGEYVIRAAAVKNIGTSVLDYINSGRVKLAAGGLVGEGLNSIGSNANSSNGVNVDARTKIINVLDPNLLQEYMNTSDGRRTLVNLISNNKSMFRDALGVR